MPSLFNSILDDFFADPFFSDTGKLLPPPSSTSRSLVTHHPKWDTFLSTPRMDVTETPNSFLFKMDVPGMNRDQIEVSVTDNVLLVEGHRESEEERKDETRHVVERSRGRFSRQVVLPNTVEVDPAKVKSSMENGVLCLEFPKREDAGRKKITIA